MARGNKKRSKRQASARYRAKGYLGLSRIRLPREVISSAFLPFTRPVSANSKYKLYAFVEVSASYNGVGEDDETIVIPVTIGKMTRGQLARMPKDELRARLREALPGTTVIQLHGFGHGLTRLERKGKTFIKGAPKTRRKTRKKGASKRNRSASKPTKKRRASSRVRHRIHKKS